MCGICFSISQSAACAPSSELVELLRKRGPDSHREVKACVKTVDHEYYSLTFLSTVLSLRGQHTTVQPLVDSRSGSVLCWNGEAWRIDGTPVSGNDTEKVFSFLLRRSMTASLMDRLSGSTHIVEGLSQISGPFSYVYYDGLNKTVYYGRDQLGRRSLLRKKGVGSLMVSSVCDPLETDGWQEVEADGVYRIDLDESDESSVNDVSLADMSIAPKYIPWISAINRHNKMNRELPTDSAKELTLDSTRVLELEEELSASLVPRLLSLPNFSSPDPLESPPSVAILFSGGVDCTLLARLADEILPELEQIDLLNVAFENKRALAAAGLKNNLDTHRDEPNYLYGFCPDRRTGISSYNELIRKCPYRRFRFVQINVPYTEFKEHLETVKTLMYPHNTEMDLSIAIALYFAARGIGNTYDPRTSTYVPYTTPARVLLSGLGADEIFGGYARHGAAFSRRGFPGLLDELWLDISRLGERNLGRDDRVISHWGKEIRYPYLDEEFMDWALRLPVWQKCGFGDKGKQQETEEKSLDVPPEKKLLRLLAWKLGIEKAAMEKKRAIQFGSRTAKMENRKAKGTDIIS